MVRIRFRILPRSPSCSLGSDFVVSLLLVENAMDWRCSVEGRFARIGYGVGGAVMGSAESLDLELICNCRLGQRRRLDAAELTSSRCITRASWM